MPTKRRSLPLYVQIESVLTERVRTGFYPAGALMPPEDRLRTEFGVSRATIRLALDALHWDSLISHYAGRGTFVNETHDQPQSLRLKCSIDEVITLADGEPADFVVTAHVMTEATAAEAAELKLVEGRRVLRVTGLRRRGEERVAHVVACIPEALGALLTARRTYFAADGTPLEFVISSYLGDTQFETIISGGV